MQFDLDAKMNGTYAVLLLAVLCMATAEDREKRWLVFPRAAPTRQQFIVGIGLPVDLGTDPFALTYGFALKAQYFLPYNVTQMRLPWLYDGKNKYRRAISERYQLQDDELIITRGAETEEETNAEQWSDTGHRFKDLRWILYRSIEMAVDGLGYDGRACMLRTICESAELPLSITSGLLAELFHIVLTPSTTSEQPLFAQDNQYLRAEQLGQSGVSCSHVFHECDYSVMNVFSKIFDPVELLKRVLF